MVLTLRQRPSNATVTPGRFGYVAAIAFALAAAVFTMLVGVAPPPPRTRQPEGCIYSGPWHDQRVSPWLVRPWPGIRGSGTPSGYGPWGAVWPDNVHETGVWPIGQCGFPVVTAEPEQVERTRRKTWSRGRSEFLYPSGSCSRPGSRVVGDPGTSSITRNTTWIAAPIHTVVQIGRAHRFGIRTTFGPS